MYQFIFPCYSYPVIRSFSTKGESSREVVEESWSLVKRSLSPDAVVKVEEGR